MIVALHSLSLQQHQLPVFQILLEQLAHHEAKVRLSNTLHNFLKERLPQYISAASVFDQQKGLAGADYVFSVGGDGTLLDTVTYVKGLNIPIFGINIGRLGFLATVPSDQIAEAIQAIKNGFYSHDERTLLQLESNQDVFKHQNFALNDFTILKRDTSSMIVVHAYIDGEYLNSYWSDGLIIATPTGSTGYSLSVGGPVIIPDSNNFIISPVSPHNLNVRPLVVSDKSVISFEIEGRSKNFLISLDSRSRKVNSSYQMAIRKCDFTVKLGRLSGTNFLNTLRRKLHWGYDTRN